jgi:hypothetical protein
LLLFANTELNIFILVCRCQLKENLPDFEADVTSAISDMMAFAHDGELFVIVDEVPYVLYPNLIIIIIFIIVDISIFVLFIMRIVVLFIGHFLEMHKIESFM